MANNATTRAMPVVLLSSTTASELIAGLPAEARAQLAWTPKRLFDISKPLLAEPMLTGGLIEKAADDYLEAVRQLLPALPHLPLPADPTAPEMAARLTEELKLLGALPRVSAMAALRAISTLFVVTKVALLRVGEVDLTELRRRAEAFDPATVKDDLALIRAAVLLSAVLEGLRSPSLIPGRVADLARRADAEAQAFASQLAAKNSQLVLPWYVQPDQDQDQVAEFASWNPKNQLRWPRDTKPATPEDLEAWERVKASIDASRPHRKLFS